MNTPNSDLLDPQTAAAYLHVTANHLAKLRVYGGGPTYLKINSRRVVYRKSDLDAWLDSRARQSTSVPA